MQPLNDPSGKSASGTFGWVGMSVLAAAMGFYITQLLYTASRAAENCGVRDLESQKDVASVYDDTADSFDSEVGVSERLMGLLGVRKTLSQQCRGHVLEVSCGTGRNIGYYDLSPASAIDSLTFIDLSAQMVDVCKKKWQTHYPSTDSSNSSQKFKPGLSIRFSTCSALDPMPPSPTGGKYDTIIQTMGICSTPFPHQLIRNMTRHLDMTNPDSRILLLEHGRSDYAWLNNILDSSGQKHAEIHGCWYNRDIGAIVRSVADETGLEVVAEKRKHLGTTWIYELRPSPSRKGVAANAANADADAVGEESKGSSWRSWFGLK